MWVAFAADLASLAPLTMRISADDAKIAAGDPVRLDSHGRRAVRGEAGADQASGVMPS